MSYCRDVVETLPRHVLGALAQYRRDFPERWADTFGPNCHWFSLGYFFSDVANAPRAVDLRLRTGFFESLGFTATFAPRSGTLVVFRFSGHDTARRVDPHTGRDVSVRGPHYSEPFHSAIYVGEWRGEGVVVQKDDARSPDLSVQRIPDVLRKLREDVRDCPCTTGTVDVCYLATQGPTRARLGTTPPSPIESAATPRMRQSGVRPIL